MTATVQQFQKAASANLTSSTFTPSSGGKLPTTTKPSGSKVFDLRAGSLGLHIGWSVSKYLQLIPYGVGSDTNTFSMRIWGWSQTNDATEIWVPQLLIEVSCAISTGTDFANITAGNYCVDTITVVAGDAAASIISPANDTPGSLLLHLRGCELFEFDFDMTGATSANCLWRVMDQ